MKIYKDEVTREKWAEIANAMRRSSGLVMLGVAQYLVRKVSIYGTPDDYAILEPIEKVKDR